MDFLDESSIEAAAAAYGDAPLDVLVNVGGEFNVSRKLTSRSTEPAKACHLIPKHGRKTQRSCW